PVGHCPGSMTPPPTVAEVGGSHSGAGVHNFTGLNPAPPTLSWESSSDRQANRWAHGEPAAPCTAGSPKISQSPRIGQPEAPPVKFQDARCSAGVRNDATE